MAKKKVDFFKVGIHIAALSPLALLLLDWQLNRLGFNPIQEITKRTGRDALVLLLLALSVSPVYKIFGLHQVLRIRRILGVYAFFYASLHFLTFIGLDFGFNFDLIIMGILEKPFALLGFTAFLMLSLLAITSTNGWKKRLGKNWKRIHWLIYLAAPLVIIHFLWASKQNYGESILYGVAAALLILWRIVNHKLKTASERQNAPL